MARQQTASETRASSGAAARLPIGKRLQTLRKQRGLTQSALAEKVGVSASYLNLIEHDKRSIGGALLNRIARELDTHPRDLRGAEDAQLAHDILDLARSLDIIGLNEESALEFVARDPAWADAFRTLQRRHRDALDTAIALSDRLSQDPKLVNLSHAVLTRITSIRSFAEILAQTGDLDITERNRFSDIIAQQSDFLGSDAREMIALLEGSPDAPGPTTPKSEVDDFIIYRGNHFPDIEDAMEALHHTLTASGASLNTAIENTLNTRWGVTVTTASPGQAPQKDDSNSQSHLRLDPRMPRATQRFQMARHLAALEIEEVINGYLTDERLTSGDARRMVARALSNYAAGALLCPYDPFHEAAERERYDIDRLSTLFQCSFEQIAHRLVTLRRRGAEGVPFAFLRSDPAGNLSKPFSIAGLRMPRLGGACPLWPVYGAFSAPGRTLTQLAVMPQGERFLFIARLLPKRAAAFGDPPTMFSVMLGCDAAYTDRLVYGDSFRQGATSVTTPVGYTCTSCPRAECGQRAMPFILA